MDAKAMKVALGRSAGCATLEELARFAEGAPGGDARIDEHVAGCLRCRTELALLKEFEQAAPRPDEEAAAHWIAARIERDIAAMTGADPAPSTRAVAEERGRQWYRLIGVRPTMAGLALAATLLLLVLNLLDRQVRPPALSPDVGAGPAVFRSSGVTLLSPTGDLDGPATDLRWEAVPGAASYSVRVMEVDRAEVWMSHARQASLSLPASVRARMVPGKPLLWQVEAKDAAGRTVATSQVQRFRLALRELPRR
jgi:hypothetical protein